MTKPALPPEIERYRVIDEKVVSEITGLALSTLRKFRSYRKGGPPFFKGNRRVAYRLNEVLAWMEAQRVPERD